MGGAITVTSQVGKGSVFMIQLPLKEGEAQAVQAKENPGMCCGFSPARRRAGC